jgi:hypothetical protein
MISVFSYFDDCFAKCFRLYCFALQILCSCEKHCCFIKFKKSETLHNFINNQQLISDSPDRADILWALGRLLYCPQIKARAGMTLIKMP